MRLLGLIGGLSWISTIDYYRAINELVASRVGGVHSAKVLLYSVDFAGFSELVKANKWNEIVTMLSDIAISLEKSGATALLICANTPHIAAAAVAKRISIPLIHIADATAAQVVDSGITTVGLIGSKATMEQDFFTEKLTQKGITVKIPNPEDRQFIHDAIFNEFGKGIFLNSTKTRLIEIIKELIVQGARGIILGCTEFPYIIEKSDVSVPLFDTAKIHAEAAVHFSLTI